jgi:hypothetical protein
LLVKQLTHDSKVKGLSPDPIGTGRK